MTYPRSRSLPRPPEARSAVTYDSKKAAEGALRELLAQRMDAALYLGLIDARIESLLASTCGANELQHVELYDEDGGYVPRAFVDLHAPKVGQLQWLDDLHVQFDGLGESPGTVNGVRWGSGALIADDLFLTAGHCFVSDPRGYKVPTRNHVPISRFDIARLMKVNFNYQIDQTSTTQPKGLRREVSYPVVELVEMSERIDFAIVRLGRDVDGKLPGRVFGTLTVASADARPGETLCVIQHPNGGPKQVETGRLKEAALGRIAYADIDTDGGASGAPVISAAGEIVGVHTDGGCHNGGGFNSGTSIGIIRCASKWL